MHLSGPNGMKMNSWFSLIILVFLIIVYINLYNCFSLLGKWYGGCMWIKLVCGKVLVIL